MVPTSQWFHISSSSGHSSAKLPRAPQALPRNSQRDDREGIDIESGMVGLRGPHDRFRGVPGRGGVRPGGHQDPLCGWQLASSGVAGDRWG